MCVQLHTLTQTPPPPPRMHAQRMAALQQRAQHIIVLHRPAHLTLHRVMLCRPPSQHILPYTPPTTPPTPLGTTPLRVSSRKRRRNVLLLLYQITYNAPPPTLLYSSSSSSSSSSSNWSANLPHCTSSYNFWAGNGARWMGECDGSRGEGRRELRGFMQTKARPTTSTRVAHRCVERQPAGRRARSSAWR